MEARARPAGTPAGELRAKSLPRAAPQVPRRAVDNLGMLPDLPALLYPSRHAIVAEGEAAPTTFADLFDRVMAIAHTLNELGVRRGDCVAALLLNSTDMVAAYFACARIGVTWVPLRHTLLPRDWAYIIVDTECSVVLVHGDFIADMRQALQDATGVPPDAPHATWRPTEAWAAQAFAGTEELAEVLEAAKASTPAPRLRVMYVSRAGEDPSADRVAAEWLACEHFTRAVLEASWSAFEEKRDYALESVPDPTDIAHIMFTSGTTGRPKGVASIHAAVIDHFPPALYAEAHAALTAGSGAAGVATDRRVEAAREVLSTFFSRPQFAKSKPPLGFFEVALCPKPLSGVPLLMAINSVAFVTELHLLPVFDAAAALRKLTSPEVGVTASWLNPGHLQEIFALPEVASMPKVGPGSRLRCPSLRINFYGGTHASEAIQQEALARFPESVGFFQLYGLTETAGAGTALLPSDHVPFELATEKQRQRMRSAGTPGPGVVIAIVGPDGRQLPAKQEGEILVGGPKTMKGYWRRPKASQQVLTTLEVADVGPVRCLRSGDLGYVDDDGYLYVSGRIKDVINLSTGLIYSPALVEGALEAHPRVAAAAVVAVPEPTGGDCPVAWIVLSDSCASDTADAATGSERRVSDTFFAELRSTLLEGGVASGMHPKFAFVAADLPRNDDSKVVKAPLVERTLRALSWSSDRAGSVSRRTTGGAGGSTSKL